MPYLPGRLSALPACSRGKDIIWVETSHHHCLAQAGAGVGVALFSPPRNMLRAFNNLLSPFSHTPGAATLTAPCHTAFTMYVSFALFSSQCVLYCVYSLGGGQ